MAAFLDIVIGSLERDGIDFFWLDWQQGEEWQNWTEVEGLNPTLWLNYVFWQRLKVTRPDERPMVG